MESVNLWKQRSGRIARSVKHTNKNTLDIEVVLLLLVVSDKRVAAVKSFTTASTGFAGVFFLASTVQPDTPDEGKAQASISTVT